MSGQPSLHQWLATMDVPELNTLRWGPLRLMFRSFVEEIELVRLQRGGHCCRQAQSRTHQREMFEIHLFPPALNTISEAPRSVDAAAPILHARRCDGQIGGVDLRHRPSQYH